MSKCDFTYQWYVQLVETLKANYRIVDYHTQPSNVPVVILRHDIDNSIEKALTLARLEASMGVTSTYFVMLKTDFYNPFSAKSVQMLQEIKALGHEIGLHFDELAYPTGIEADIVKNILQEIKILSDILQTAIKTVSMHRPSSKTLEADWKIPGVINSYGQRFFKEYKYLSDSRCHWREPVMDIIASGEYPQLHILTHAFWYHDTAKTVSETIREYVRSAATERYAQEAENIRDLSSILSLSEINLM